MTAEPHVAQVDSVRPLLYAWCAGGLRWFWHSGDIVADSGIIVQKSLDGTESLAADYALGVLESDEARVVEDRIACDVEFARLVTDWQMRLALMVDAVEPAQPPANLFDKIEAQISELSKPLPDSLTLRSNEGEWSPVAEGVDRKVLWNNDRNGRQTILFRMAPGARFRPHHHDDYEECYLVSGDLTFGDHKLQAGDFHVAFSGSEHPPATTQNGCVVLISTAA